MFLLFEQKLTATRQLQCGGGGGEREREGEGEKTNGGKCKVASLPLT